MLSEYIDYFETIIRDENFRENALAKICEYLPDTEHNTEFPIKLLDIIEKEEIDLSNGFYYHTLVHKLFKNGQEIEITPIERKILDILAKNPDRVVSHNELITKLWGYADDNTILRVNIGRLRNRINYDLIECHKGEGYSLRVCKRI